MSIFGTCLTLAKTESFRWKQWVVWGKSSKVPKIGGRSSKGLYEVVFARVVWGKSSKVPKIGGRKRKRIGSELFLHFLPIPFWERLVCRNSSGPEKLLFYLTISPWLEKNPPFNPTTAALSRSNFLHFDLGHMAVHRLNHRLGNFYNLLLNCSALEKDSMKGFSKTCIPIRKMIAWGCPQHMKIWKTGLLPVNIWLWGEGSSWLPAIPAKLQLDVPGDVPQFVLAAEPEGFSGGWGGILSSFICWKFLEHSAASQKWSSAQKWTSGDSGA